MRGINFSELVSELTKHSNVSDKLEYIRTDKEDCHLILEELDRVFLRKESPGPLLMPVLNVSS